MEENKWFYSKNNKREGPVDESFLRELLLKKKISKDTLVWNSSLTEWRKIESLDEFKVSMPVEPPPLPLPTEAPINQNRPWIRYWARNFDFLFFIAIVSVIYFSRNLVTNANVVLIIGVFFLCIIWIPIEAMLLSIFGSTPGKYLLNTYVKSLPDKKASFGQTLKRSFLVWIYGNGFYIPLVSFINQYLSFLRLKANLPLKWDLSSNTRVEHKKIGSTRTVIFIILYVCFVALYHNEIKKNTELGIKIKASNMWINLGDYEKAIINCNEVIEKRPTSADAFHYRGYAYYKAGLHDKALSDFNVAIKLNKRLKGIYNNRGLAYHALGKTNEAINDYTKSINEEPYFHNAYNNKGMTLLSLEKYTEALDLFNKSIELSDSTSIYYFNRAKCYTQMESLSLAVKDYSTAIKINPLYTMAYNNRGYVYLLKKEYEIALEDFTLALSLDSLNAQIWSNRATTFLCLERNKDAIRDFKKAARMGDEFSKLILRSINVRW